MRRAALLALALPLLAQRAVDPFLGTGAHGHTFPGATRPFGLVQLSPDNGVAGWDWVSGYHWSSKVIAGFSHTHLDGTGIGDLCDLLVAPRLRRLGDDAFGKDWLQATALPFDHKDERAEPGFYTVAFPSGLRAELTATARAGLHRYTFPQGQDATLVLDLGYAINFDRAMDTAVHATGPRTFAGRRHSKGWAADQKLCFALALDRTPDEVRVVKDGKVVEGAGAEGRDTKLVLTFRGGGAVQLKVALSTVDEDGARANLAGELPGWDFAAVCAEARQAWHARMGGLTAEHLCPEEAQVFDTALYRCFLAPNVLSDLDGRVRGADGAIHRTDFPFSSTLSLWDTYRALHPLFTLVAPDTVDGFVKSMLAFRAQKGQLPNWALWNQEAHCMIGYHAVPVLVEAYLKGLTKVDGNALLEACVAMADREVEGLKSHKTLGFVDAATEKEACAKTLEYAYDDSAIARLAEKLGRREIAERFLKRAASYRAVFDPKTGFMRGKKADGTWVEPFSPVAVSHRDDPYCEGNAWQWSWSVQHDPAGLVALFGGPAPFAAKLDALFTQSSKLEGGNVSPDISGLLGQLAQGNEPSHHIPYLYAWAGQPWKTQARVRELMATFYMPGPEGLCGNDDCGQMSAWYVFSALGFYPVDPASGVYVLGSPRVKSARLALPGGQALSIRTRNQAPDHVYVQAVTWRGRPLSRPWLRHEELVKGGTLEFTLGPTPNPTWGSHSKDQPPRFLQD